MSFLELKPAARRLRQVAKAHAAGEIPRDDYRRVRRQIIEDLHVDFSESIDSPVDQFSLGDKTRRRPSEAPTVSVPQKSTPSRSWIESVLFVAVSLVLIFLSTWVFALEIPPVAERDPNPKNSLVLPIDSISLQQGRALSEIDDQEVTEFLRSALERARAESSALRAGGFTSPELEELGALLQRLGVHNDSGLDESSTGAINALIKRQRARRGVTLVQLERVAEELEALYRKRGYLAARVFIPAQTIAGQEVSLTVLPGRLDELDVSDGSSLAPMVTRAFGAFRGQVAERDSLEQLLYKLNDLPGVRASGRLQAGAAVGSTQLNLSIDHPRTIDTEVFLDNWGDERSARYRVGARLNWNNPFQRGDQLVVTGALRADPQEAANLGFVYQSPFRRLGDTVQFSGSTSRAEVAPRGFTGDVDGDFRSLGLGVKRVLDGSRVSSRSVSLNGVFQRLALGDRDQSVWGLGSSLQTHRVFDAARWVVRSNTRVLAGKISSGRFSEQSDTYVRANTSLSAWRPMGQQSIRFEVDAQLGSNDLPDSQKFRLGDPRRLSSIRPGAFVADSAVLIGAEVSVTPTALRPYGRLDVYTRLGHGERTLFGDRQSAFAWDAGVMWRLPERNAVSGSLRLGIPLVVNGMEDSHDFARVLFDLVWRP